MREQSGRPDARTQPIVALLRETTVSTEFGLADRLRHVLKFASYGGRMIERDFQGRAPRPRRPSSFLVMNHAALVRNHCTVFAIPVSIVSFGRQSSSRITLLASIA